MRITVNLPIEFNESSDSSNYEFVYLKDAVSAIKESLPYLISNASDSHWTISCIAGSDNGLSVEIFSDDKTYNLSAFYQLHNIRLFFVDMTFEKPSDNKISFKLQVLKKHKNCFYRSILDVARSAQDEIQFLLDHEQFWSFRSMDVILYLTSERNLFDPRVLAKLPEFVESDNLAYRSAALCVLKQALNDPQIKELAKNLITKLAQPREEKCTTYWAIRLSALTALSKLLHEPDVRVFFEDITQNDERHAVRTHALNLLENLSDAEFNYRVELYQRMILKLLPQNEHDSTTIFSLEFCIWNDPAASGEVFRSGHVDVNRLVKLFRRSALSYSIGAHITGCIGLNPLGGFTSSINQTAALYSILKLIAYTCDDIAIFKHITKALIDITQAHPHLGLLDSIGELLDDVCKNARIEPPQKVLDLRKPRVPSRDNNRVDGALLGGLNQEREYSVFTKVRIKSLFDLIGNPELDANIRIVAIRDCQQYLFTKFDYSWVQKEYKGYRNQLMPQLYEVAKNSDENKEVRRAAYQIISWYRSIPENVAAHRIQSFWYKARLQKRQEEHEDSTHSLAQNFIR
ncbi:MAG: hypothetical protein Q8R24_02820 [Legionellaceae bacterium]|nr:hypothetical protein [Legionellaceae bacterium]